LGGSIVAVVSERHAQELVDEMARRYYLPRDYPVQVEIASPVGGAGVIDV